MFKKFGITFLALAFFAAACGEKKNQIFGANDVDETPAFRGDLPEFIQTHLEYPESALADSLQGQVLARFVINREGAAEQYRIEESLSPDCDSAVIRMLRLMPPWVPGKIDGFPVPVLVELPVLFTLQPDTGISVKN